MSNNGLCNAFMKGLKQLVCQQEDDGSTCSSNPCQYQPPCNCNEKKKKKSCRDVTSMTLDKILDISATVVQVMTICGIEERKANNTISLVMHIFLNFGEKHNCPYMPLCKLWNACKADFYCDLRNECCMTHEEASLSCNIVKCALNAFYHQQGSYKTDIGFFSESDWQLAVNRTIYAFCKSGATKAEVEKTKELVETAYKGYLQRLEAKTFNGSKFKGQEENPCCCCPKKKGSKKLEEWKNMFNKERAYSQAVCKCCCAKKIRDSKNRCVLLVEGTDLCYNMKPICKQVCCCCGADNGSQDGGSVDGSGSKSSGSKTDKPESSKESSKLDDKDEPVFPDVNLDVDRDTSFLETTETPPQPPAEEEEEVVDAVEEKPEPEPEPPIVEPEPEREAGGGADNENIIQIKLAGFCADGKRPLLNVTGVTLIQGETDVKFHCEKDTNDKEVTATTPKPTPRPAAQKPPAQKVPPQKTPPPKPVAKAATPQKGKKDVAERDV